MSGQTLAREREMDAVCERLALLYATKPELRHGDFLLHSGGCEQLWPVEKFVYDTDDTGRIEWIHIIYRHKPDVDHVEITGMSRQEASDAVTQKIHENWF